jgi:hypothetical protein
MVVGRRRSHITLRKYNVTSGKFERALKALMDGTTLAIKLANCHAHGRELRTVVGVDNPRHNPMNQ